MKRPFLTAKWQNLFMANYEVAQSLLEKFVPAGTELDLFQGKALVSLVAFQFQQTRVKGFKVPWHVNFPEINLRFYLKRVHEGELRRGVAFIREIVPRQAITLVANLLFNENYVTRKMAERVRVADNQLKAVYTFVEEDRTQTISAVSGIYPQNLKPGSLEDFITEHYYGYTGGQGQRTIEYRVEHPSWRTYTLQDYRVDVDFGAVYGEAWSRLTGMKPHSVLLAEGSDVSVYAGEKLT
ncbi:YqjF family protein [Turneriella parva]|uniref:DUF2071 domain-containing protein n=1 Tax=Turneriella parva (strain ATCC BAA-1111 / DSM 21527 / NCTC 11395 / H) TaxID=869212 RepID=I4B2V8_TURPD|nr:DUF2071 domain-containing protein [Turneriella parva]AFM11615.1 Protein of unknown function DUF2071 [Turneriella parva DSM 21527]